MVDALHFEAFMQAIPCSAFVPLAMRARMNEPAALSECKHGGNGVAATFADDNNDLALAALVGRKWAARAAAFLKHKLKDTEVTYAELAKRLKKHGLKETEASIANKLARGTFP
jgi:hypothetical protein